MKSEKWNLTNEANVNVVKHLNFSQYFSSVILKVIVQNLLSEVEVTKENMNIPYEEEAHR